MLWRQLPVNTDPQPPPRRYTKHNLIALIDMKQVNVFINTFISSGGEAESCKNSLTLICSCWPLQTGSTQGRGGQVTQVGLHIWKSLFLQNEKTDSKGKFKELEQPGLTWWFCAHSQLKHLLERGFTGRFSPTGCKQAEGVSQHLAQMRSQGSSAVQSP